MAEAAAPEELNFEQAFKELRELVEALEDGDLPLEDSLRLYERGQALAARCNELLEHAELRLKELAQDESRDDLEIGSEPESG